MQENPYLEIIKSIYNVFTSDFSTTAISESCEISYTTVSELRRNKRELSNTSIEICNSLYRFAKQNQLDEQFLQKEKQKGSNNIINIEIPMKKVIVSFEPHDLFCLGLLHIKNESEIQSSDSFSRIDMSESLFIAENNKKYDAYDLGFRFNCRYAGTGPNNFADFIFDHSKMSKEEIQDVVFNHSIVEYDFHNDTLTPFESTIHQNNASFGMLHNKLIILFNFWDNNDMLRYNNKDELLLEKAAFDINLFRQIMQDQYEKSPDILHIRYIKNHLSDDTLKYKNKGSYFYARHNNVHIVIEFADYEIWLPYRIYQDKGSIFKNEEMASLLSALDITLNTQNENKFTNFLEKFKDSDPIQTLSITKID
ncbi:hypothetical protein [Listeria newyorkensis]|uniref:hypothetical protein n=1 Tax=Listeria newyorkensis TaxID=1497681 RepID=UPI00051D95A9|nr:hypothetical protein [Listeria newyorkensis]KGL43636.1 hypothetical protein EP58_07825 [Listeria newyorkensis]